MKKIISLLLSVIMLCSVVYVVPFAVSASQVDITNDSLIGENEENETSVLESNSIYVPNYTLKMNDFVQPLYNPETVSVLYDFCMSNQKIGKNDNTEIDEKDDWTYASVKHEFAQVYLVENNTPYGIGYDERPQYELTFQNYFSSVNGTVALKQVSHNGVEKYAVVVAFRGTDPSDVADLLTDVSIIYNSDGIHSGFAGNASAFLQTSKKIIFNVDDKNITLYEIIQDMKKDDSKFSMLVTGHSLGGAVADVFVGDTLYKEGVSPRNVMAYTFAAPKSVNKNFNYPYKNIINIISEDDLVPTVGGNKRIGMDYSYLPDDTFRKIYYGDKFVPGLTSFEWRVKFAGLVFIAHYLESYEGIYKCVTDNIGEYTSYHTNEDYIYRGTRMTDIYFMPTYSNTGEMQFWNDLHIIYSNGPVEPYLSELWPGDRMYFYGYNSEGQPVYQYEIPVGSHFIVNNGRDLLANTGIVRARTEELIAYGEFPESIYYLKDFDVVGLYDYIFNTQFVCDYETYPLDDGSIGIIGYTGKDKDVIIPNRIEGKPVKAIGYRAFWEKEFIESVTIPDGVTLIGDYVFSYCKNLQKVNIPDSVTAIGEDAFLGCTSLDNITIPDGVTSIENWTFFGCENLKNIAIPNGVTSIGESAFYNCKSLTEITIPDSVKSIGEHAFYNCENLDNVIIPDVVTSIERGAFSSCTSLTSIKIPDGITSIGEYAFSDCTSLTSIVLPDSVTNIEFYAFSGCTNLTSIVLPDGITSIGEYAFSDCKSLSSISLPANITDISEGLFFQCKELTNLELPAGITSIGEQAFSDCSNLKNIDISGSLTRIGNRAFYKCMSLTSIIIPKGVTSIEEETFYDCKSLTNIEIPDGVLSIGDYAFYNCESLISISIPDSVVSIGFHAYQLCFDLFHVFYLGTEEQWNSIEIDFDNSSLTDATRHYNASGKLKLDSILPSCTDDGSDFYICTICDEKYPLSHSEKLGHNYVSRIVPPSCTEQGYTLHKCSRCDDEYKDTYVEKSAHEIEANSCTLCRKKIESEHPYPDDSDENWTIYKKNAKRIVITFAEDTEVEESWDYIYIYNGEGEEIYSFTGTEMAGKKYGIDGDTVKIRLVSDGGGNEYGFALSHIDFLYDECLHPQQELINVYKETCGNYGYTGDIHCKICAVLISEGEAIPPTYNHEWVERVHPPTCVGMGYTEYHCKNGCGGGIKDVVDATGKHEFTDGYCNMCSVKEPSTIKDVIITNKKQKVTQTEDGETHYFKYVATESGVINFYSEGSDYAYAEVYDSDMKCLAWDDGSMDGMRFYVSYEVEANQTYYLSCAIYEEIGDFYVQIDFDSSEEIGLLGDVDGDSKVSVMDATAVQRHVAQLATIPEDRLVCADTDKDGKVSVMDATMIQRFVAQLIPSL
ncbi:MAG: leucine-rich repeat protein [Ruminococcus sp.]|nr:leucine-rich repeat protein [Ruminococcus sp.]